ncbi:MAG: hypothetical protein WBW16_14725 [Bacteroidota bacterium]
MKRAVLLLLTFAVLAGTSVQNASAQAWLPVLKFFAGWLAGKVLDGVVDQFALHRQIEDTRQGLERERYATTKQLEDVRDELAGTIKRSQNRELDPAERSEIDRLKEQYGSLAASFESKLQLIDEAEQVVHEFHDYVASHRMTDQELINYCNEMLQDRITPLERRVEGLEQRVSILETEMVDIRKRLEALENEFSLQPVIGMYYQGLTLLSDTWNQRYGYLPSLTKSKHLFSGGGLSFGFWLNRLIYIEANAHYLPEQKEDVVNDSNKAYTLTLEGLGWSAKGILTLRVQEGFVFDIGGGYGWDNYQVGFVNKPSIVLSSPTVEIAKRNRLGDPIALVGLRVGNKGVYVVGDMEFLFKDLIFRGYYLKAGLQFLL